MPYEYLTPLLNSHSSKIVLLIMDGLGGLPLERDGLTELETAATPNLDALAAKAAWGKRSRFVQA
jgi:2,3-bisphosphoglycerate-independent phosphoglycerate mutase